MRPDPRKGEERLEGGAGVRGGGEKSVVRAETKTSSRKAGSALACG